MAQRTMQAGQGWPALELEAWRDTYETLHLWTQIVGKTRLALAPMENHWWQVALYVTPRGVTTSAMPLGGRTFAVELDFVVHELVVRSSDGDSRAMPLVAETVADFYARYRAALEAMGLGVSIMGVPVEIERVTPFAKDREHAAYDRAAANRWWRIVSRADRIFKQFRGRFVGKQSPSHFFWGSFDLATTRFSGRRAPLHPGGAPNCPDYVMQEAYSHECSSCGFWPGGGAVAGAAFYAYSYPAPDGYGAARVQPAAASYNAAMGEFILPYDAVRASATPDEDVLAFLQSTYDAAADLGHWDRAGLDRGRAAGRSPV
mgnify:FL=1